MTIVVSALGTQRAATQLPQPTETFKLGELGREFKQIYRSLKNRNFAALFSYGLFMGSAAGLGAALYLYNVTYFFEFTGFEVAITATLCCSRRWLRAAGTHRRSTFRQKSSRHRHAAGAGGVYPIPYICVLTGVWPEFGSTASIAIYTALFLPKWYSGLFQP